VRVALVNPAWSYGGSIYFGCQAPHLPIELGCTRALLAADGNETLLLDGQIERMDNEALADRVAEFAPDFTVVSTAPTYMFWRCPPPELRVPADFLQRLAGRGGRSVAVGPHGTATANPTLRKLGADLLVRGECEETVAALARNGDWSGVPGTACADWSGAHVCGEPAEAAFTDQPPLDWPDDWIAAHRHHHHRLTGAPDGYGAEVEASRGYPAGTGVRAWDGFRHSYRQRELRPLLGEIDRLIAQGVTYLYFIDEVFLPRPDLLEALAERNVAFGIQTRIEFWTPALLEALGRAGCVSMEAGLESLSGGGDALAELLIEARRHVHFVEANLVRATSDSPEVVADWRMRLIDHGVWASDPEPRYPYPGSPEYVTRWGPPDDTAWERAHAHFLERFTRASGSMDEQPLPLPALEANCATP
jgi:anaerobic magnesium-protoporphyrin IX monomethyl ester cyclase